MVRRNSYFAKCCRKKKCKVNNSEKSVGQGYIVESENIGAFSPKSLHISEESEK
jgi:hypothetical protein